MSMRNSVYCQATCPNCNRGTDLSFCFDEGAQIGHDLQVGELLPWWRPGEKAVPVGIWTTEGVGQCRECLEFILADIVFEELKCVSIQKLHVSSPNPIEEV